MTAQVLFFPLIKSRVPDMEEIRRLMRLQDDINGLRARLSNECRTMTPYNAAIARKAFHKHLFRDKWRVYPGFRSDRPASQILNGIKRD